MRSRGGGFGGLPGVLLAKWRVRIRIRRPTSAFARCFDSPLGTLRRDSSSGCVAVGQAGRRFPHSTMPHRPGKRQVLLESGLLSPYAGASPMTLGQNAAVATMLTPNCLRPERAPGGLRPGASAVCR